MTRRLRRPTPLPAARLLAACLAVVLLLGGCATIPMTGPVGTSDTDSSGDAEYAYTFSPPGPAKDASPQEIIQGFLLAGLAPSDDYSVAREYLAPELAREWRAADRTIVHRAEPNIVQNVQEGSYTVEMAVESTIDRYGILSRKPEHATESSNFQLEKVDDQWRISRAPNGTMVEEGNFTHLFASYPLYFYDATFAYAVADYRWFAKRQGLPATIVESLLAGPAPYLRNAVFSAFPEGSELARASVPVESRRATVDFAESVFTDATELRRQQMQQQLELTLGQVRNIGTVSMTVAQRPVSLGNVSPEFVAAKVNPSVPNTQIAISRKELVYYQGNGVVRVGGVPDVSGFGPRDPAMAPGGNRYAFLNANRTKLVTIDEAGQPQVAATGRALLAPSIDTHGWTWTVDNDGGTHVLVVPADRKKNGQARQVTADWMRKAKVSSLRISLDGARALVVASIDGESAAYISGVIRDSEGVPRGFTDPLKLPTSVPVGQGVWSSADSVIVMKANDSQPVKAEEISLNGDTAQLEPLLGMTNISAGPGEQRTVYAETPDGLYSLVFSVWKQRNGTAQDLAYPG